VKNVFYQKRELMKEWFKKQPNKKIYLFIDGVTLHTRRFLSLYIYDDNHHLINLLMLR